jgi:hypothetical protein
MKKLYVNLLRSFFFALLSLGTISFMIACTEDENTEEEEDDDDDDDDDNNNNNNNNTTTETCSTDYSCFNGYCECVDDTECTDPEETTNSDPDNCDNLCRVCE